MEGRIKLEVKTCSGEIHEVEIATLSRRTVSATDEDIGLSLADSKAILAAMQHAIVTTQIDEDVASCQVCKSCQALLLIRDRRTRRLQTLFGTIEVSTPRIRVCACINHLGMHNLSRPPLTDLLSDRCTPELRRLQVELVARLSYRDAARILSAFLPCSPPTHSSIRNRLGRVADDLNDRDRMMAYESGALSTAKGEATTNRPPVTINLDSAHIRAIPATQSRLVGVNVGKVLDSEGNSRRFGFAPGSGYALNATLRAALVAQG